MSSLAESCNDLISRLVDDCADRFFLIDGHTEFGLTYREFDERARIVANSLIRLGCSSGQRVGILMPNGVHYPILYFACIRAGLIAVPINPAFSDLDIRYIIETARCSAVLHAQSLADRLPADASFTRILVKVGDEGDALDTLRGGDCAGFIPHRGSPSDIGLVVFTSGTTARPKGVAHRMASLMRNAQAFAAAAGIDEDTRFLNMLPMAYMAGFLNLVLLPFVSGGSTVASGVFDARSAIGFWKMPAAHDVTAFWMTPSILAMLLRGDRGTLGEEYCRNRVRHLLVGTAPLPDRTKKEFERRYGIELLESYGLSETLFVTTRVHGVPASRVSVGRPIDGVVVEFDDSEQCAGQILVSTPDMMIGYLDPATGDVTAAISRERMPTGDIGHFDSNGALVITGRLKDLIIRGGVNVSPAAVEEVLRRSEAIAEVAVVGLPHDVYGEEIIAVVKLQPGVDLPSVLDELETLSRDNLSPAQRPSRFLRVDELPCSVTGKVQKQRVRQLAATALGVSLVTQGGPDA